MYGVIRQRNPLAPGRGSIKPCSLQCLEMATRRRENLRNKASQVKAATDDDMALYEYVLSSRTMMRDAARKHPGKAGEAFVNMVKTYDLLVKYGRFFVPMDRPKKYMRGKKKECFGNSLDLAMAHEELRYCEGLTLLDGLPVPTEHGWCVTEAGSVVDVTLKSPGLTYFGVAFDTLFAATRELPVLDSVLVEQAKPAAWRPKQR
jgi:hypothetical protein